MFSRPWASLRAPRGHRRENSRGLGSDSGSDNSWGLTLDTMTTSYFLSRSTIVPTLGGGMAPWRVKLFASMHRNAASAADFLSLSPNRVVELGTKVRI